MKQLNKLALIALFGILGLGVVVTGCTEKMIHHDRQASLLDAVEQAQTKDDHEAIANRYDAEADKLTAKAEKHEKLAALYKRTDNSKMARGADAARHCREIAQKFREAAAENKALAKLHREMAR